MSDEPPRVFHKTFSSRLKSLDSLFDEAADFAGRIGQDRLINISHSSNGANRIVTVWYWETNPSSDAWQAGKDTGAKNG